MLADLEKPLTGERMLNFGRCRFDLSVKCFGKNPRVPTVSLTVLLASLLSNPALGDVTINGVAQAGSVTSVSNAETISLTNDYLNVDDSNTQLTGTVTNTGTITTTKEFIDISGNSIVSANVTNSGSVNTDGEVFRLSGGTFTGNFVNEGTITGQRTFFTAGAVTSSITNTRVF